MKFLGFIFLAFASYNSSAALLEYDAPQILARSNIRDGYNMPAMSFLSNTNPDINNRGDVTFRILAVEGENDQAIWFKNFEEQNGKIIYVAADQRLITDPSINDSGNIVFNLHDEGVTDGLFILDSKNLGIEQVLSPDNLPIQYYTYPQIKNNGHIYFRATNDFDDRTFFDFNKGKLNKLMAEGVESQGIKSSYLFKPSINDSGVMAFKTRIGERGQWNESNPDQIVVLSSSSDVLLPAKLITIAKDHDSDPLSPYLQFGNTVSISKQGLVAFIGVLNDSKKVIVISKEKTLTNVAKEGENDLSEIELTTPKINEQGLVVFRAKDSTGKRGIYIADGSAVKKIIAEGDEIMTDLGPGKILSNPNYPGINGDVDMNDHGEIVFSCLVVDGDNRELGSAVYKINPKK